MVTFIITFTFYLDKWDIMNEKEETGSIIITESKEGINTPTSGRVQNFI
jgi:hypothetical protein